MALGPNQLTDFFKEEVNSFEKTIDERLRSNSFSGVGSITIDTPKLMTAQHLTVLRDRYISAGWTAVTQSYGDQRDPCNVLTFTKK